MPKLDILVNHYQESPEIVRRLLDSIQKQRSIRLSDIRILMFSDGTEHALKSEDLSGYSFHIEYQALPHHGVCATRNSLLDNAQAKYVIFCDCDDEFSKDYALNHLLAIVEKSGADIVGAAFDRENKTESGFEYIPYKRQIRWLHCKIFRRQYLITKKIRFPDEMLFSGDMYFLFLAFYMTARVKWVDESLYTWKWMPVSVTRGKTFYPIRTYGNVIECYRLLVAEWKRRNDRVNYNLTICWLMKMMYMDWFWDQMSQAPQELSDKARAEIRRFAKELYKPFSECPTRLKERYISDTPDFIEWLETVCTAAIDDDDEKIK